MAEHVHVIVVDSSLTEDEAWAEMVAHGERQTNTGSSSYVVRRCDGEECWRIGQAAKAARHAERHRYPARMGKNVVGTTNPS